MCGGVDLNNDNSIDLNDLILFSNDWLKEVKEPPALTGGSLLGEFSFFWLDDGDPLLKKAFPQADCRGGDFHQFILWIYSRAASSERIEPV